MVQNRSLLASAVAHSILLAGAAFMLMPFMWMLITSLKTPDEVFLADFHLFPSKWGATDNYISAFAEAPLLRLMLNGAFVSLSILVIQVVIAAPCAYALAKIPFRGSDILMSLVLLGLMIPIQVPALPIYIAFAYVGLLDTYTALIIPFSTSVFCIFLLRQFFKTFPHEIIEAARLDGYSELEIVWLIVVPSSWPAIAAFSIFSVVGHWNDLYWPLIVITDPNLATPPLGLMMFRQSSQAGGNIGALMAAGTIVIAPLVLAFLFAQAQFIRGLTVTGLK
ncbi:carbohydrate ABC transporter permease [Neorhizobium galegae]|uniref:carbohydrate ABC transporter permease n=1 Tax=Neorhizobium galegae TaxID=399 RepID=UPI0006226F01|nr:carbohydrate ABC transporter permease [Neorhizobium galegae]CDZ64439.1 Sugar ABC transporter, permease protein [Neorhizobium galegae bv. orientalis]KAB1120110.1 carbohydrate ABC transporter permease [Neorhizobium galegae]MCQ1575258.1 carbohydrate ABC transporter permease [Neorhizobium galegae]MCQ1810747.1 carbohydrate ABC transporter permease [Neorhizobium galegae]MCQ1838034.1 carbohydrate ABC transporter permease [Neorhizobium galegae]